MSAHSKERKKITELIVNTAKPVWVIIL